MKKSMTNLAVDFMEALLSLDKLSAEQMMEDEYDRIAPIKFVEEVVIVALEQIGALWQEGTIALSQIYMAGRICEDLVNEMLPPADPGRKNQPKMAICVLSDHHKLGKVIVYSLLRACAFELSDYGTARLMAWLTALKRIKLKFYSFQPSCSRQPLRLKM